MGRLKDYTGSKFFHDSHDFGVAKQIFSLYKSMKSIKKTFSIKNQKQHFSSKNLRPLRNQMVTTLYYQSYLHFRLGHNQSDLHHIQHLRNPHQVIVNSTLHSSHRNNSPIRGKVMCTLHHLILAFILHTILQVMLAVV